MTTTTFRKDITYSSSSGDNVNTPQDYDDSYNIYFTTEELVAYFETKGVTITPEKQKAMTNEKMTVQVHLQCEECSCE